MLVEVSILICHLVLTAAQGVFLFTYLEERWILVTVVALRCYSLLVGLKGRYWQAIVFVSCRLKLLWIAPCGHVACRGSISFEGVFRSLGCLKARDPISLKVCLVAEREKVVHDLTVRCIGRI